MRNLLSLIALALILAGCVSTPADITPRSPREALAAAEISFVGAVTIASDMHRRGILSTEDARNVVLPRLEEVNEALTLARQLVAVGDGANALETLSAVQAILDGIALDLHNRAEAARSIQS